MSELTLTKKDFQSDQDVRWCPGCGDYAILNSLQQVLPTLGIPKEKFVIVSGIGCSSRFPYYMNTYGFHTIHGRAPAVATGVKITNSDLSVWVVSGDGDSLSIGGNHLIHTMRRNINIKLLLFDNRIYGLTKGQYSPTSELGKRTKSSPYGSLDRPFNPIRLALAARATFVARSIDTYAPHLKQTLNDAAGHEGSAFIQILQNCNIFNDGAFSLVRDKATRDDNLLHLEHGKPLIFGKEKNRGIRMSSAFQPEVVQLGNGITEDDLLVHDETAPMEYASMLAGLETPEFPLAVGVLRRVKFPTYGAQAREQIKAVTDQKGHGTLESILGAGDTWTVS
jgi:2-oxoglutarate ferredoxin oxidoreductase subunit beta